MRRVRAAVRRLTQHTTLEQLARILRDENLEGRGVVYIALMDVTDGIVGAVLRIEKETVPGEQVEVATGTSTWTQAADERGDDDDG